MNGIGQRCYGDPEVFIFMCFAAAATSYVVCLVIRPGKGSVVSRFASVDSFSLTK